MITGAWFPNASKIKRESEYQGHAVHGRKKCSHETTKPKIALDRTKYGETFRKSTFHPRNPNRPNLSLSKGWIRPIASSTSLRLVSNTAVNPPSLP